MNREESHDHVKSKLKECSKCDKPTAEYFSTNWRYDEISFHCKSCNYITRLSFWPSIKFIKNEL